MSQAPAIEPSKSDPDILRATGEWTLPHASRLLAHIIETGRVRKCRFVTLEVRRSNAAAARLYRRFGFRAVGVRPNYYAEDQEDAIVMLLDLT